MEREPLLYRTVSISQLGEIEPLLLASIVGGYMVTPYDFSNFSKCNNEDDDNNLQVCVSVCVCIVRIYSSICDVCIHVYVCDVPVCVSVFAYICIYHSFLADLENL